MFSRHLWRWKRQRVKGDFKGDVDGFSLVLRGRSRSVYLWAFVKKRHLPCRLPKWWSIFHWFFGKEKAMVLLKLAQAIVLFSKRTKLILGNSKDLTSTPYDQALAWHFQRFQQFVHFTFIGQQPFQSIVVRGKICHGSRAVNNYVRTHFTEGVPGYFLKKHLKLVPNIK